MTAGHARLAAPAFVDRHRGRVIGVIGGRPVFAIAGGSESPPEPPAPPAPPADDTVTMTQAELTAKMAREKQQGKAAAESALAAQLGVSVPEAKKLIEQAKNADRAAMSDADKARADAEAEKTAAAVDRAAAAQERRTAAIERTLIRAGVVDDKLTRAARTLELDDTADADAITAAVTALAAEEPAWFGKTGIAPAGGAPGSHTGGRPPAQQGTKKPGEAGKAEATRRFAHLKSAS